MKSRALRILAGMTLVIAAQTLASAEDAGMAGLWEGPWYRGMTSGRVKLDLREKPGTIQFTNLDNFGTQVRPLQAALENGVLKLRAEGEQGGPLTASLKPNEAGNEMKGMGKFEGFPLRFEIKRAN